MGGVFVNYRFDDERFGAGAVYDGLAERFGKQQVFRDCVSMHAGEHYPTELRRALAEADILVAVVGPTWLTGHDAEGNRLLDRPNDWVRAEIRDALRRGIPILPVLTAATARPSGADLPEDIAAISRIQAHRIDHAQLAGDVHRLADRIAELVPEVATRELFAQPQPLLAEQPSAMLRAEHAVVPFTGRADELAYLSTWAAGPAALSVRLVTGPAGQGKTRFAQRLCEELQTQGWLTGLLREDAASEVLRRCSGLSKHALLVVDYAETRVDQLTIMTEALLNRPNPATPIRLLLLARSGGEWLRPLVENHSRPRLVTLFELVAEYALELKVLLPGSQARQAEFTRAVHAFAARLHRDGTGIVAPFDLEDDRYGRALDLYSAALVALLDHGIAGPVPSSRDPILRVLHHEYHYWNRSAETFELPDPHPDRLRQIAAAATVFGAADDKQARGLLSSLRTLTGQPDDVIDRYLRWLKRLYPGTRSLNPMQPDRLGEDHCAATIQAEPSVATNPVPIADSGQLTQAVTVLGRAASRHGHLTTTLTDMIALAPNRLIPVGLSVVPRLENPYPLVTVLSSAVADHSDLHNIVAALEALPVRSVALAGFAVTTIERAIAIHRALPHPNSAIIAALLTDLSSKLDSNGLPEQALIAIDEALDQYRRLIPSPAAQIDLIRALHSKALLLSRLHRTADAVATGMEAVELSRAFSADPAELALSLTVVALELGDLQQYEKALAAAAEATELYRKLAEVDPASYLARLAISLNTVAIQAEHLGQPGAVTAARAEANTILRTMAATAPDANRRDLAMSLQAEAMALSNVGRTSEALAASREAAGIMRYLDELEPDVHRLDFGVALTELAARMRSTGQSAEAVATLREAISVFGDLNARVPGFYQAKLAMALRLLAATYREADDIEAAIATGREAAEAYRQIPEPIPEADQAARAALLRAMATWLVAVNKPIEAIGDIDTAFALYTDIAAGNPGRYTRDLGVTLSAQAVVYDHADLDDRARNAAARAVEMFRLLPGNTVELASALHNYAILLAKNDDVATATQQQREAVGLLEADPRQQHTLRQFQETWESVNGSSRPSG